MISIIVPVYNGEKYIQRLMESFDDQSFKDFEVLFIDDGSTDGTSDRILALSKAHFYPTRLYQQENAGVSAARNAGIQLAQGEYICFIDADDYIHRHYLKWLYKAINDTGCNIVLGTITRDKSEWGRMDNHIEVIQYQKDNILKEYLYHGRNYHLCASMIRTTALRSLNLSFSVGFRYSEDVHFLWRLFARQECVSVIQKPIYCYIDNPLSAMRKMDIDRMDAINLMTELEPYMQQYAPDFSMEFSKYAVARHYWSILWQAAGYFNKFQEFRKFHEQFNMKENLKKLFDYPDRKISLSARIFCMSEHLYYILIRIYLKNQKRSGL